MKKLSGIFLCSITLIAGYSQALPIQDYSIKVEVEEVRIDATVLDSKGRQITNLTADEFELSQDGKIQKLISCSYISENQAPAAPNSSQSDLLAIRPVLPRNEVRRTIAFVVDDLAMTFENHHSARIALRKFTQNDMQTGDLAAILQTSGSMAAQQQFTSDKRQLLSRIKSLPWGGLMTVGAGDIGEEIIEFLNKPAAYSDISIRYSSSSPQIGHSVPTINVIDRENLFKQDIDRILDRRDEHKYREWAGDALATLKYCIRALHDLPGRKSLVFMSSQITNYLLSEHGRLMNELADEALRAGVVVYTLDMKGSNPWRRNSVLENFLPLSKKTGGIIIENSNIFLTGISPIIEASKGYYLLSYVPPANTFTDSREEIYHRVQVKVKRRGSEVHTRDGFLGIRRPAYLGIAQINPLQKAIFSPFQHSDLEVSLISGYAYTSKQGYFLRSWLHLDGKYLTFTDEENNSSFLSLEFIALSCSPDGDVQDSKGRQYKFRFNKEEIAQIRQDGIDLNTYLPVKNPGDYYVRAAIKDVASGRIGSAYQFLSVPDLKKRDLALSSIFVLNQNENASAVQSASDSTHEWRGLGRSPALRSYRPGEAFNYMVVVYNSKNKEELSPQLEFQFTIYRDGKEYLKSKPEDVALNGVDDLGRIPIAKRLSFNSIMDEGSYVFKLRVSDKLQPTRTAAQAIDFQIRKD